MRTGPPPLRQPRLTMRGRPHCADRARATAGSDEPARVRRTPGLRPLEHRLPGRYGPGVQRTAVELRAHLNLDLAAERWPHMALRTLYAPAAGCPWPGDAERHRGGRAARQQRSRRGFPSTARSLLILENLDPLPGQPCATGASPPPRPAPSCRFGVVHNQTEQVLQLLVGVLRKARPAAEQEVLATVIRGACGAYEAERRAGDRCARTAGSAATDAGQ